MDTRASRGPEIYSDYYLVFARMEIRVKENKEEVITNVKKHKSVEAVRI